MEVTGDTGKFFHFSSMQCRGKGPVSAYKIKQEKKGTQPEQTWILDMLLERGP